MKNILITALLTSSLAFGATYKLDQAHSTVGFEVSHLGITKVPGQFNDYSGTFEFDENTQTLKNLKVEIKTASVNTNNKDRDAHLTGKDFFNSSAKGYETATFTIKGPVKVENMTTVDAKLTLNKKTHTVPVKITYNGMATFMGTPKTAFDLTTTIDRTKFGITWNGKVDSVQKPGMMDKAKGAVQEMAVGTMVDIKAHVEANQNTADKSIASQE